MSADKLVADIHKDDTNFIMNLVVSAVKPLVMELNYKYGLVIISEHPRNDSETRKSFVMGYPSGVAVGEAYIADCGDHKEFCFYTPHYEKERGRNNDDRHTFRSKKISTLMNALRTKDAVASEKDIICNTCFTKMARTEEYVTRDIKHESKQRILGISDSHTLLKLAMGEIPMSEVLPETLDTFRLALQHYNKSDETDALKTAEYNRFYGGDGGFHAVCAVGNGYFIVGKFKATGNKDTYRNMFDSLEPMRLIKNFDNEPELQPLITILKSVASDSDTTSWARSSMANGVIPLTDCYDQSLDMVFYYDSKPNSYSGAWMLTPCL
jgi:hypothetical protein